MCVWKLNFNFSGKNAQLYNFCETQFIFLKNLFLKHTFVVISGNSLSGPNFKDFLLLFSFLFFHQQVPFFSVFFSFLPHISRAHFLVLYSCSSLTSFLTTNFPFLFHHFWLQPLQRSICPSIELWFFLAGTEMLKRYIWSDLMFKCGY